MKLLEFYVNQLFIEKFSLHQCFQARFKLPAQLSKEIRGLAIRDDALLINGKKRNRQEILAVASLDPTVERWEYSLNRRHLNDYFEADCTLLQLLTVFIAASFDLKIEAQKIGVADQLCFIFSSPATGTIENAPVRGTTMTFYRLNEQNHVVDPTKLDEFKTERLAVLLI
jgi:hypothetical protein